MPGVAKGISRSRFFLLLVVESLSQKVKLSVVLKANSGSLGLNEHCRCTEGALKVHCICITGALKVHCSCIEGALQVNCRCNIPALQVHWRCISRIAGALQVHCRYTTAAF